MLRFVISAVVIATFTVPPALAAESLTDKVLDDFVAAVKENKEAKSDAITKAVKDVVHVHDLHATMLQLLGVDHTKLVHRFQGRDYRLTDVFGKVVKGILA